MSEERYAVPDVDVRLSDAAVQAAILETVMQLLPDLTKRVEMACENILKSLFCIGENVRLQKESVTHTRACASTIDSAIRAIVHEMQFQDRHAQTLHNLQLMLAKHNEIFLDKSQDVVQVDVFKSVYESIRLEDVRRVFLSSLNLPVNTEQGCHDKCDDGDLDLF